MRTVNKGLIVCPRPDLSTALVDIVEWRVRAHDGQRLWGLHGESKFHERPRGACLRFISSTSAPEINSEAIAAGKLDLVFQIPPGRRLEDRVLDLLRIWQVVTGHSGVDPDQIEIVCPAPDQAEAREADEFLIANGLIATGLA